MIWNAGMRTHETWAAVVLKTAIGIERRKTAGGANERNVTYLILRSPSRGSMSRFLREA